MAGTATTVFPVSAATPRGGASPGYASKLLEVNFTGVVGAGTSTTRAVFSEGIPLPGSTVALGLWWRVTNNIGGPAGDDIYGVIELLMPGGLWHQVHATPEMAFNTNGAGTAVATGVVASIGRQSVATSPGLTGVLIAAGGGSNMGSVPVGMATEARIAFNVIHVAGASGSANITAELWSLPL
jgi:hypothetical protein